MSQRILDEYRVWLPRLLSADVADLETIRAVFRNGNYRQIEVWKEMWRGLGMPETPGIVTETIRRAQP